MAFDLTDQLISKTFENVLQVTGSDSRLYDLSGSAVTNLFVSGTLTTLEHHINITTSSILYRSGSTKFGDSLDDTHQLTGSLTVTSSNLTISSAGSISGSATSTGSFGQLHLTHVNRNTNPTSKNQNQNEHLHFKESKSFYHLLSSIHSNFNCFQISQ